MTAVSAVTAVSGKGFVGDASYGKRNRQVLIIDSETLNELELNPGDVRENVTLVNFELSRLSPHDQLVVGEILLAVTGHCAWDMRSPNYGPPFLRRCFPSNPCSKKRDKLVEQFSRPWLARSVSSRTCWKARAQCCGYCLYF